MLVEIYNMCVCVRVREVEGREEDLTNVPERENVNAHSTLGRKKPRYENSFKKKSVFVLAFERRLYFFAMVVVCALKSD